MNKILRVIAPMGAGIITGVGLSNIVILIIEGETGVALTNAGLITILGIVLIVGVHYLYRLGDTKELFMW